MIEKINLRMAVIDLAKIGKDDEVSIVREMAQKLSTANLYLDADGYPIEGWIVSQFLEAMAAGPVNILDPNTGEKINESSTTWDSLIEVDTHKSVPLGLLDFNADDLRNLYRNKCPLDKWQYGRPYEPEKKDETKIQRLARLNALVDKEKADGNRAFLGAVAEAERISITRLKQLLNEYKESQSSQPNRWEEGLSASKRQTSLKKRET